jgi:hypothetical protein
VEAKEPPQYFKENKQEATKPSYLPHFLFFQLFLKAFFASKGHFDYQKEI